MIPGNYKPILYGVVGSTAYNLAKDTSDIDTLGVFMAPTEDFFLLKKPQETFVSTNPDMVMHELNKFINLIMKGNPTVIEVLFMSEYITLEPEGQLLIDNRLAFLSTETVRKSYIGYVNGQLKRLINRKEKLIDRNNIFADPMKRRAKHARHCYRLLLQAEELLTHGMLTLKLSDINRKLVFSVGEMDDDSLLPFIEDAIEYLKGIPSVLPNKHDTAKAEEMLLSLRFPKG